MDRNEIPQDARHLVVPSGASKMIFEPVVRSVKTVQLCSIKISTISKQTKLSIHLSLITEEYHQVHPKWFYELVVCSAQTVHLSCFNISTIPKWTKSGIHLSFITKEYYWVRQKWFLSLRYVWRKPCTYLASTPTLSSNGPKGYSTWPTSPWSSVGCVQNDFWGCGMFGTNRSTILH
jgi:hypothetical protein